MTKEIGLKAEARASLERRRGRAPRENGRRVLTERDLLRFTMATAMALALHLVGMASPGWAQPPAFVWAVGMGGAPSDAGYNVALDGAGNVYTTGFFQGTADFDPGPGTFNLTSAGSTDVFVQKLDANGNFLWAVRIGGASHDEGFDLAVDGAGNVHITGYFRGTVDFDPGPGTFNLTSAGLSDIFVLRLDSGGNLVWAVNMGGFFGWGLGVSLDGFGNVYSTGYFHGTADFDPGPGTFNLTSAGSADIFVQKLHPSGNFLWAVGMGGASFDSGRDVTVDSSGSVYTTGLFRSTVDFDPGPGTFNLTSAGGWDIFVQKLDGAGNLVWVGGIGGTGDELGPSLAVDSTGNVYTTGTFEGVADFDPGPATFNLTSAGFEDIFVHKLNANGTFLWAGSMGGSSFDAGLGLAVDSAGDIYTTGQFSGTVDFDPGPGTFNLTSAGASDIFVQKLDPNGNFLWVAGMGGPSSSNAWGCGIAVDGAGAVYTTGLFTDTVDFDPGPGTFNLTSAGPGGSGDIFVLKLQGIADTDGDGVPDDLDVCPGTVIPEATVPSVRLGVNRWALVDGDSVFDTTPPPGGGEGPGLGFTVEETGGCSCEQIIDALGLGQGHVKFGCSNSAMEEWVALVSP